VFPAHARLCGCGAGSDPCKVADRLKLERSTARAIGRIPYFLQFFASRLARPRLCISAFASLGIFNGGGKQTSIVDHSKLDQAVRIGQDSPQGRKGHSKKSARKEWAGKQGWLGLRS
jgi:hypothetical protein